MATESAHSVDSSRTRATEALIATQDALSSRLTDLHAALSTSDLARIDPLNREIARLCARVSELHRTLTTFLPTTLEDGFMLEARARLTRSTRRVETARERIGGLLETLRERNHSQLRSYAGLQQLEAPYSRPGTAHPRPGHLERRLLDTSA